MILKISKGLGHKCPRPFYIAILKLNVARGSSLVTFTLPTSLFLSFRTILFTFSLYIHIMTFKGSD